MSDHDQVTFSQLGGAAVVRLAGEIDMANAPAIGREIVLNVTGARAVLIDLTEVTFLDSGGVRLLDVLVGDLEDHGVPIRFVVDEAGAARKTLMLCAFRDELLATDLDRAAAELNSQSAYPGAP
jgi:anti-sigma B factor antagonist